MGGLGTGISAFVNGFVGGRDVKHRWEDRKDQKARQKKLDEYRAEQEKRLAEKHGWAQDQHGVYMDTANRQQTEWEQGQADRAGERDALATSLDMTDAYLANQAEPTSQVTAPPVVSTKGQSLGAMPQLPGNAPMVQMDSRHESPAVLSPRHAQPLPPRQPMGATPQPTMPPKPQAQAGSDPLFQNLPDGRVVALRQGRTPEERAAIVQAAQSGRLAVSDERQAQQQQIDQNGPLPYDYGNPGAAGQDIRQAGRVVRDVVGNSVAGVGEQVINSGVDTVQRVNAPFQAASRWITGEDQIGAPERVDLNRDGQTPTVAGPVGDVLFGKRQPRPEESVAPKNASPTEKNVSQATQEVVNDIGNNPGMQAAANATPTSAMGVNKGKPMTKPQRKKAATSFVEAWLTNGMEVVQREMIRQGRFDDAKALEEWANTADAQKGMETAMEAIFALSSGDLKNGVELVGETYNTPGYNDNGYDMLVDESDYLTDGNGEIAGVRVGMRNQATGEIFHRDVSMEELPNFLYGIADPAKAFERSLERQKAMAEALVEAEKERAKTRRDLIKTDYEIQEKARIEMLQDEYKRIVDPMGIGVPPVDENGNPVAVPTWEEFLAQRSGGAQSGAGSVPVLRPQ